MVCQLASKVFHRRNRLQGHLAPNMPRVSWSLDCAPSIKGKGGKSTVLIIVDDFSKLSIMRVLPHLTSGAVFQTFMECVVSIYGRPCRVRVDGGKEFAGKFKGMLRELGIAMIVTSPGAPWTNGIAERMVGFLKQLLKKSLTGLDRSKWMDLVPYVQAAVNHTVSRVTGYSPCEVFFGEQPEPLLFAEVGPLPVVDAKLGNECHEQVREYVQALKERLG